MFSDSVIISLLFRLLLLGLAPIAPAGLLFLGIATIAPSGLLLLGLAAIAPSELLLHDGICSSETYSGNLAGFFSGNILFLNVLTIISLPS